MTRVLITGMSGTGKSTVIAALAAQGYPAIDADTPLFSEWSAVDAVMEAPGTPVESDRDWVWRTDRTQAVLDQTDTPLLFISGCAANMGQFLPAFDHVIVLRAPAEVLLDRVTTRTTNTYGTHPDEAARILALLTTVEPLLRRIATHEIDSTHDLALVVRMIRAIAEAPAQGPLEAV